MRGDADGCGWCGRPLMTEAPVAEVSDRRRQPLRQLHHRPDSLSRPCGAFISNRTCMFQLPVSQRALISLTHFFPVDLFWVAARGRILTSRLSLSLSEGAIEAYRGQTCLGLMLGERGGGGVLGPFLTSWLEAGWARRCLSGPALHCHSRSRRTDPGQENFELEQGQVL